MFKVTKYPHGHFSWADCISTNQENANKFYTAVMGWDINNIPMGEGIFYTMFERDGASVAGLGAMQPDMLEQNIPSHWNNYVNVDNVDTATEKAKSLGATVITEPFDVFDSGRMSYIQDPIGARLGLWQAKNHIGAGLVNTPGAMVWNELSVKDPEPAQKFYGNLFGWDFKKDKSGYLYVTNSGRANGGFITMTEEWGDMSPNWMVYFSVADLDTALEKVKTNGGTVHMGATDAADVGRFAVIGDPAGAVSTIMQLNQPEPWDVVIS